MVINNVNINKHFKIKLMTLKKKIFRYLFPFTFIFFSFSSRAKTVCKVITHFIITSLFHSDVEERLMILFLYYINLFVLKRKYLRKSSNNLAKGRKREKKSAAHFFLQITSQNILSAIMNKVLGNPQQRK